MSAAAFEWGFHYAGPRVATSDMRCVTCLAGAQKRCPTHGEGWDSGCAHCRTAQGEPCQAHWGLEAALESFGNRLVSEEALLDFEAARQIVMGELSYPTKPGIIVTMRSSGSLNETGRRELHIQMVTR